MSSSATKKTAFNVLKFLQASIADGSVKSDDVEGLEVAAQCISEAFGVDVESEQDEHAYSITPDTLPSLLDKIKHVQPQQPTQPEPAPPATVEQKAAAEKAKAAGNQAMAKKDYNAAVRSYGEAIEHDAANAVYWSNRAAAHSQLQAHESAIADAKRALEIDPSFSKAYSRLGHALYSSGQYKAAVEAYENGLKMDPTNATMKSSLATAKSRVPEDDDEDNDNMPELESDEATGVSSRAAPAAGGAGGFPGMPAGFPGMGGAGGMPDLAGLMSNPAIMQMAQQMMGNGGMEQLMNNPMLRQMMNGMGGAGGGMPDMSALLNDPAMRRMAEQMGAGRGTDGAAGEGQNADMYS